jgi:excinuclease UvrABC nuclease subunit
LIPGIGPKRKKLLLEKFGSIEEISKLSPEELSTVLEISIESAKNILKALQQNESL